MITKLKHYFFYIWLSFKLLFNRRSFYSGSGPLSFLGLILGVATLVVSQSVMRGYEYTLKKSVIEMNGDIQVLKKSKLIDSWVDFQEKIYSLKLPIRKIARFANTEAVFAKQGQVSGVILQAFDFNEIDQLLEYNSRLESGVEPKNNKEVMIGVGLARRFKLSVSDKIYLAVPLSTPFETTSFRRSAEEFVVSGILDMGKNEWNERLVITRLDDLQQLTQIGNRISGVFIKLVNSDDAVKVAQDLNLALESQFHVNNWYNLNRNLLEAVKLEKVVIFFVVFLIVLIAAFNISSMLYVIVRSRFKDISILKTIGFNQKSVKNIFLFQGFLIGSLGTVFGFIFGYMLSILFMYLQSKYGLLPGAVYKLDKIVVQFSLNDFIIIYFSTLMTCLLASYFPAKQASQLTIIDGMKKD